MKLKSCPSQKTQMIFTNFGSFQTKSDLNISNCELVFNDTSSPFLRSVGIIDNPHINFYVLFFEK